MSEWIKITGIDEITFNVDPFIEDFVPSKLEGLVINRTDIATGTFSGSDEFNIKLKFLTHDDAKKAINLLNGQTYNFEDIEGKPSSLIVIAS